MLSVLRKIRTVVLFFAAISIATAAFAKSPYLDMDGELSFDGLYPVKKTHVDNAWASEDLDLSGFDKVLLLPTGLHYRPVKDRGRSMVQRSGTSFFPLDSKQQARLQEIASEEFNKELSKLERFEVVRENGPGVIAVRGGIYDIVSRVPPEPVGRSSYYLSSVGEATLVLELVDIPSNTVIARIADRRSAEQRGIAMESNTATNSREARRVMKQWARLLRNALENILSVDAAGKVVRK